MRRSVLEGDASLLSGQQVESGAAVFPEVIFCSVPSALRTFVTICASHILTALKRQCPAN